MLPRLYSTGIVVAIILGLRSHYPFHEQALWRILEGLFYGKQDAAISHDGVLEEDVGLHITRYATHILSDDRSAWLLRPQELNQRLDFRSIQDEAGIRFIPEYPNYFQSTHLAEVTACDLLRTDAVALTLLLVARYPAIDDRLAIWLDNLRLKFTVHNILSQFLELFYFRAIWFRYRADIS